MSDLTPEQQYQKEYDEAMEAMDAAAAGKTVPTPAAPAEPEPEEPAPAEPVEPPPEAEPVPAEPAEPEETVEQLRQRLARAEKEARDNKAFATRKSQENAELKRKQHAAERPEILELNPGLEDAIRHVTTAPEPVQQDPEAIQQQLHQQYLDIVESAHPGIFAVNADKELVATVLKRKEALGDAWFDPLVAIREISDAKLELATKNAEKRASAAASTKTKMSAMSIPGPGGSGTQKQPANKDEEEVNRIRNMSPEDFAKERRRVMGY